MVVEEITRRLRIVEEKGFINYFGTQRLGDVRVVGRLHPYEVGRALVKRDYQGVVRQLLVPRSGDSQVRRRRRRRGSFPFSYAKT